VAGLVGLATHTENSLRKKLMATEFLGAKSFQKEIQRGSVVKNERRSPVSSLWRLAFHSAKYRLSEDDRTNGT
jgi:hypothetical protein